MPFRKPSFTCADLALMPHSSTAESSTSTTTLRVDLPILPIALGADPPVIYTFAFNWFGSSIPANGGDQQTHHLQHFATVAITTATDAATAAVPLSVAAGVSTKFR